MPLLSDCQHVAGVELHYTPSQVIRAIVQPELLGDDAILRVAPHTGRARVPELKEADRNKEVNAK